MLEQFKNNYRGGGDAKSIAQRLSELKRQGCVTVATGEVPSEAMQAICRRMFGDPDLDRQRLLVSFRRNLSPGEWLPADLTIDHESVAIRDRSAAVRELMATAQQQTDSTLEDELDDVAQSHLDAVVSDVVDVAAGLVTHDPGRVRVAVLRPDHLFPDPQRQSLESLANFVIQLRTLMQRFGGMALLVVPAGDDGRIVDALADEADVEFEVRKQPSFVEQRVIIDPGAVDSLRSDWHELP